KPDAKRTHVEVTPVALAPVMNGAHPAHAARASRDARGRNHVDDEALVVTRHATDTGRVEWSRAWGSGCLSWPEQPQGTPLLREHPRRAPPGRLAPPRQAA